MVTLRPERGTSTLDAGDEIVPSKRAFPTRDSACEDVPERGHAVKGARAGPVGLGGEGNIEDGSTEFGS